MPAVSKKQRRAMAIAEHNPGELYAKNKGLAKMSKSELHKFASTSEKGLPLEVKTKKRLKKVYGGK
jgi:hypothetical protein